jgi:hypothetical protein
VHLYGVFHALVAYTMPHRDLCAAVRPIMLLAARTVLLPPGDGCWLAGYGMPRRARSTARPLEANLLLGRDLKGAAVLIVCFDLLFVGRILTQRLREAFPSVQIVPFASHTHAAPVVDPGKPRLGVFEAQWTRAVGDVVAAAAAQLLTEDGEPAYARSAEAAIGGSIHRRFFWPWPMLNRRGLKFGGSIMAPNPAGPTGDCARLLEIQTGSGKPLAVVWSWACHPTSLIDYTTVSSDYIGPVRDALRRRFGSVPVIHLQGFAGDVRPPGSPAPAPSPGMRPKRPRFVQFTSADLAAWERGISEGVAGLELSGAPAPIEGKAEVRTTAIGLDEFLRGAGSRPIELGHIRIGDALDVVYLEAEPSAEHADLVRSAFPRSWPVGYAGDVFGYFPTDRQVPEGGYEVYGFMPLFGIKGRYSGSLDAALQRGLARLG